jgi:hypothetical protein
MPDLRSSTALRQLADLGQDPVPPRWSWAVRTWEPGGRIRLPAPALAVLGHQRGVARTVHGVCRRTGLVLDATRTDGPGFVVGPDGRLLLPAWLRRTAERSLLVGAEAARSLVVVAPASVLDAIGDLLAAGRS